MSYSLAFFKFRKSIEREIRNYWSVAISADLSDRWLSQFEAEKRITELTENAPPFSYVDIKSSEFTRRLPTAIEYGRENAVVNFITAFEVYLFEILSRIVYINPSALKDSDMKFEAKDIVFGLGSSDFKRWFSDKSTDKTIRNKQHSEIIKRIAKLAKIDLTPINVKIEQWNKWTYVRNSVVHTGRRVSSDLHEIWKARFPTIGANLNILNNELMLVQTVAMAIAKHLDLRVNEEVIEFEDSALLIRELFIREGIEDPNELKRILHRNLSVRATRPQIEKVLGFQRRTNSKIAEIDFDGILSEIER